MCADNSAPSFFDGISPEYVMEVDTEIGCYIGSAGYRPEQDWAFLYHDNKYHIYFYGEQIWDGKIYDVKICSFSSKRFDAPFPFVQRAYLPVMLRNMEKFFQDRDFMSSKRPREPSDIFRSLIFEWNEFTQRHLLV